MIESGDVDNRGPAALSRTKRARADTEPKAPPTSDEIARVGPGPIERAPRDIDAEIRRRLARAQALKPGREIHCGHCWGKGRQATLDLLQEPEA